MKAPDGGVKLLIRGSWRAAAFCSCSWRGGIVSSGWRADGKWRRLCWACLCRAEVCIVNQVWTRWWHFKPRSSCSSQWGGSSSSELNGQKGTSKHDDSPASNSSSHLHWTQSRRVSCFHQSYFRSQLMFRLNGPSVPVRSHIILLVIQLPPPVSVFWGSPLYCKTESAVNTNQRFKQQKINFLYSESHNTWVNVRLKLSWTCPTANASTDLRSFIFSLCPWLFSSSRTSKSTIGSDFKFRWRSLDYHIWICKDWFYVLTTFTFNFYLNSSLKRFFTTAAWLYPAGSPKIKNPVFHPPGIQQ